MPRWLFPVLKSSLWSQQSWLLLLTYVTQPLKVAVVASGAGVTMTDPLEVALVLAFAKRAHRLLELRCMETEHACL
ncbi:hypothetical protein MTO96_040050 [Rhipicephalus appendiculatus]